MSKKEALQGFALSPQQERLWLLRELRGEGVSSAAGIVLLEGRPDVRALVESFEDLVERHEILRTVFHVMPGLEWPVQVVQEEAAVDLQSLDAVEESGQGAALDALTGTLAQFLQARTSTLADGPTIRCGLARLDDDRHALFVGLPALCADAATFDILFAELVRSYGERRGELAPKEDEEEVLQYADVAAWQSEFLEDPEDETRRIGWRPSDPPPFAEFRLGCQLEDGEEVSGEPAGRVAVRVDPELWRRVEAFAECESVTWQAVLLAGWQILLSRQCLCTEVVTGVWIAGREYEGLDGALGPLAKALPVRSAVSGGLRGLAAELGARLKEMAEEHDGFFWDPRTEVGGVCTFPFTFAAAEGPAAASSGGVRFRLLYRRAPMEYGTAGLEAVLYEDGPRLELGYRRDRLAESAAEMLLEQFVTVLHHALEHVDAPVGALEMLGAEERRLLWQLNASGETKVSRLFPELFAAQVGRTPEQPAVRQGLRTWSYAELDRRATRVARRLSSVGVGAEWMVAVLAERSCEMLAGLLGIHRAGAAYLPLDPSHPAERLTSVLDDAGVEVVLTQRSLLGLCPAGERRWICLDEEKSAPAEPVEPAPTEPEQLAYVIYTSGSTGRPKGVMVSHAGLADYLMWCSATYDLAAGEGCLVHSPLGFDLTVTTLLAPLVVGGTVVLLPEERGLGALSQAVSEGADLSLVKLTPAHLDLLVSLLPAEELANRVRTLILGGEPLRWESVRRWQEKAPGSRLVNEYGPTEAVVGCCIYEVPAAGGCRGGVPIGRPVPDARLHVLDRFLRPTPFGVAGELGIAGVGLARGYLGRPGESAARFVPDPFAAIAGERLYRTGDLVRWRPGREPAEAELLFLGRIDSQIKLRGYRIELGEIETVLTACPAVREVVVLLREDRPGEPRLVAYVLPHAQEVRGAEIRGYLAERLPEYMVPALFEMVSAWPLTPNGKVDRDALPAPREQGGQKARYVAPRNLVEEVLAGVWAEVLGVERVGVEDNFFQLGGDSIRSITALTRARERGFAMAPQAIFDHPTLADLARRVMAADQKVPLPEPVAPLALTSEADRERLDEGIEDAYPLARLQGGMLFHSRLNAGAAIYHDISSFRVRAELDLRALRRVLERLIAAHPVLRTSFRLTAYEVPLQLVHRQVDLPLRVEDLRYLLPREQEAAWKRWVEREKRDGFATHEAPLIRFQVHVLSDDVFQLSTSYHHAIVDGWSIATLLTEMFQDYGALLRGESLPAGEAPAFAFRDFVALEQNTLASPEARDFWCRELEGYEAAELPRSAGLEGGEPRVEMRFAELDFSEDATAELVRLAQDEKVPLKSVLLAAHLEVLRLLSGRRDLLTGFVTHGRPEVPRGEELVGLFLNTLPLRVKLEDDTWRQRVQGAFAAERRLLPYRRFPLAEIQQLLGRDDLLESVFNFVHFSVYRQASPSDEIEILGGEFFEEVDFPYSVNFMFDASLGFLRGHLHYDARRFSDEQVKRLRRYYAEVLAAMATAPTGRPQATSLLPAVERQQLLREWSQQPGEEAQTLFVPRFESQVDRRPDAVAVTWGEGALTYARLDDRADRLARHLRWQGVDAETVVGVYHERSPLTAIAFLAILKAGAAYLPLDPAYPQERLAFMIRAAGVRVLLSRRGLLDPAPAPVEVEIPLDDPAWLGGPPVERRERPTPPPPEGAAYVIFTSGSTGTPKGVVLRHRGLSFISTQMTWGFRLLESSRVLLFAALGFDASVSELAQSFWAGAELTVASREEMLPGPGLAELLRRRRVSHLTAPPSVLANLPSENLPGLGVIISAGEECSGALAERWAAGRRFINGYGPTEGTIGVAITQVKPGAPRPDIGLPLPQARVFILDADLHPVPLGLPGQLFIGGAGIARGYLGQPNLTAERFLPDPWSAEAGARLYATGDRVRFRNDGHLDFLGRVDRQVKVRGFRVEPEGIELVLARHPGLREVAVVPHTGAAGITRLMAYVVPRGGMPTAEDLRTFLLREIPEYMVPSHFQALEEMPLNPAGKIDRRALPAPAVMARPQLRTALVRPQNELERQIAEAFRETLELDEVGLNDSFFDLGGNSLLLLRVHEQIQQSLDREFSLMELFERPTVSSLAAYFGTRRGAEELLFEPAPVKAAQPVDEIAVIGLSGRFPGAADAEALWRNLVAGEESITFFSEEELLAAGVDRATLEDPSYVRARAILEGVEEFDAAFFGFTPREAALMDPQHRLFLQQAWLALEDAGYDPRDSTGGRVGVFAGASANTYLFNLLANVELVESGGIFQTMMSNDKDFLTTQVSYKLGLEGPSVAVQTACSTSLVAVHMACRSLQSGECEMALAGGVSVRVPQVNGYRYVEGGVDSIDGHCRPFDAAAGGTVAGNGVALVVLKALDRALTDGDHIRAVIKGSAINNDGSRKVGYTAPRIEGQARVIHAAHRAAGVTADTISYVEAHGTATRLGDPIEVAALKRAFRHSTDKKGFCALGSVKSNFGHLDAAAGVAGLIKAVLVLEHGQIPPSLHFQKPNAEIDFADSPFFVNDRPRPWGRGEVPRRAGVSSFGIGGTNVHVVLEEAPVPAPIATDAVSEGGGSFASGSHLLVLSARTPASLAVARERLAEHLEARPDLDLADVARTLQTGRHPFAQKLLVQASDPAAAVAQLRDGGRIAAEETRHRPVAFLFPGQGSQHVGMARGLYERSASFRAEVDHCAAVLEPHLGVDLRRVLFPDAAGDEAEARLRDTAIAQPALFVVEYALARLWMRWGVEPEGMLGHSIGEYVAACLAGVFPLEYALALVAARGRLMKDLPAGAMLGVPRSVEDLGELPAELAVAAVNGPGLTVLSGPLSAVEPFEAWLADRGIEARRLHTSHAFHSAMMDPALEPFTEVLAGITLAPPTRPFLSNLTGGWITAAEATDASYWVRHLRGTVRFGDGLAELCTEPERVLLEVGPGQALSALARCHPARQASQAVVPSLPHAREEADAADALLAAVGGLWLSGREISWQRLEGARGRRLPLPTYHFERRRHWLEAEPMDLGAEGGGRKGSDEWLYLPSWKRCPWPAAGVAEPAGDLRVLFLDVGSWLGDELAAAWRRRGEAVVTVRPGVAFARLDGEAFEIDPGCSTDYGKLFEELAADDCRATTFVHLWNMDGDAADLDFDAHQDRGFYSLLHLGRELARQVADGKPRWLIVAASGLWDVLGGEPLSAPRATLLGPCRVIPQEVPGLHCRVVDLGVGDPEGRRDRLLLECEGAPVPAEVVVAHRGRHRWRQEYEAVAAPEAGRETLREGGVYAILGGLGNIGLTLAEHLVRRARARLVLTRHSPFPASEAWDAWLAEHGSEEPTSQAIGRLRELLELGGEVHVETFDLAEEEVLRRVLDETEARWGRLDGVLHCAGNVGNQAFRSLDELERSDVEGQLAAKVHGSLALARILAGRRYDFCHLFSSLSSVLGGLGFTAYAAVNAFQDALAAERAAAGEPWTAIDWDAWQGREPGSHGEEAGAITPAEGMRIFDQILALPASDRVVVSTGDLAARLRRAAEPAAALEAEPAAGALQPRPGLSTPYVAPRDDIERRVAAVWTRVLGIEEIGVQDNFLELGGHSLLATQLVSQLRGALGRAVPLRLLFEAPTVAGLCAWLTADTDRGAGDPPPLVPVPRAGESPMSFAQQRLWFMGGIEARDPSFNLHAGVRLEGSLAAAALERSLGEILRRHEVLRTRFAMGEEGPIQVVLPRLALPLPRYDLGDLPPERREEELHRLSDAQARHGFDLGEVPLLRTVLVQLGVREHVLLLTIHHIVWDGWSFGVFMREMAAHYHAALCGERALLPELKVQYADFSTWQQQWLQGRVLREVQTYWRRQLAGAPPLLELPGARPRPEVPSGRGARLPVALPAELSDRLQEFCRRHDVTLFMLLLTAFQITLRYHTKRDDVVVGTDVAGRDPAEVEDLIGFFINQLVLRTDLSGDPTFEEALGRVRQITLSAYQYQHLPFDRLVATLNPSRNRSHHPLFQIKLVLQNLPVLEAAPQLDGLEISFLDHSVQTAQLDLIVNLTPSAEGLRGTAELATDLYTTETIQRFLEHFEVVLARGVEEPRIRLSALDERFAASERERLKGSKTKRFQRKRRAAPATGN